MPAGSDYLHQVPRSPYWYYIRDVPADLRAKAGVAKWKQSLRTTARAEALKKARQLAVEHDRLIDETRRPAVDPFSTLSAAERERVESSGGLDLYLKFLDERALESRRNVDQVEYDIIHVCRKRTEAKRRHDFLKAQAWQRPRTGCLQTWRLLCSATRPARSRWRSHAS